MFCFHDVLLTLAGRVPAHEPITNFDEQVLIVSRRKRGGERGDFRCTGGH